MGRRTYQLESLEPRILLSNDCLGAAIPSSTSLHSPVETIQGPVPASPEEFSSHPAGADAGDLFAGLVAADLPFPDSIPDTSSIDQETLPDDGIQPSDAVAEQKTSTQESPEEACFAGAEEIQTLTDFSNLSASSMTEQLTETLKAANPPPSVSFFQYSQGLSVVSSEAQSSTAGLHSFSAGISIPQPPPAANLTGGAQWQSGGPTTSTGAQVEGMDGQGNPVAGAIRAIAVHPTNTQIVYVGAANGGIWRTSNFDQPFPTGVAGVDLASSGSGAKFVVLADLNGDSYLDLLEGDNGGNRYHLNDRSGGFGVAVALTADAFNTRGIAVGDVNGDDRPDIITVNGSDEPNRLYLHSETGALFTTGSDLPDPASDSSSVALGDMDNDGDLDLVVGNIGTANRLYLNDGKGVFAPGTNISAATHPTSAIALGDVNKDGWLDVVEGNANAKNQLYLNNKSSTPFSGVSGTDITTDLAETNSLALGDLNGDGWLDLVVGNFGQKNKFYLNNGAGAFPTGTDLTADIRHTTALALGDMNSDGRLDVVVGNFSLSGGAAESPRLYLNNGTDAPFAGVVGVDITTDAFPTSHLAVGDIDRDNDLDVVTANSLEKNRIYRSNETPIWQAMTDEFASLSVGALQLDPTDPNIIWAGTGKFSNSNEGGDAVGLFKGVVAGGQVTWQHIGKDVFKDLSITQIAISRVLDTNGLPIILVTTLKSENNLAGGVYRSKQDLAAVGGLGWDRLSVNFSSTNPLPVGKLPAGTATDVVAVPDQADPTKAAFFAGITGAGLKSGVWKSTDGGTTWVQSHALVSRPGTLIHVKLAFGQTPPANTTVYAAGIGKPVTELTVAAAIGATTLTLQTVEGLQTGDKITLDEGTASAETVTIRNVNLTNDTVEVTATKFAHLLNVLAILAEGGSG